MVRIAVVTGASSGLGREIALSLSRRGFEPLLVARRADRLEALREEISKAGGRAHVLELDVTSAGAAGRTVKAARSAGEVVALVNNAGVGVYGPFRDTPRAEVLKVVDLNVRALVEFTSAFLPLLVAGRQTFVLNVASTAAFQPVPWQAVYAATKAFVLSFTEGLAVELEGTGVSVSALCPGPTDTEFLDLAAYEKKGLSIPRAALARAADVAEAGVDGVLSGKRVIVPGLLNRAGTAAATLAPRSLVAWAAGRLFKPRG